MTDDTMKLRSLVEKSADADLLREMIGFAAVKLMELEVSAKTGAGYGEKNVFRYAAGVEPDHFKNARWKALGSA
ncbi:hypothetical protein AGR8A_pTi20065 [Agrobacterium fabrum str. J-07]|nr:hypothetical protein AGR8A_pTi20065 [Agrobacterium fabrum str. J-07]